MILGWLEAVRAASVPEVRHIVYFVGENPPSKWETGSAPIRTIVKEEVPGRSIGHYHNLGAAAAETEWIMKLDIDTVPHVRFFRELLPVLRTAGEQEWFNAGMIYLSRPATNGLKLPVSGEAYSAIMAAPRSHTSGNGYFPQASNFICRRHNYLSLGGCLEGFKGYGWEDYQQLYMLEKHQQGKDPLPGLLTLDNVTNRCRDEISRKKAKQLWERNRWLVLLHRWHQTGSYKTRESMARNRELLFNYVSENRSRQAS